MLDFRKLNLVVPMDASSQLDPRSIIFRMLGGQIVARCVGLVADLGIADQLAGGSQDVDALAEKTGTDADALYRVLRMLAGIGVFAELPERRFENNPLSDVLREDAEGSLRHVARWCSDPLMWRVLGDLDYSVRTSKPAMLKGQEDRNVFEAFKEHPASVETFNKAMTSVSRGDGQAVVEAYDFSPFLRIVDVGGGHGLLATLIAAAAPQAHVTVFDLPHVVAGAASLIGQAGLDGRVTTMGGSYLDSVPGPADLVVTKNIIHGENDDNAVRLLRNGREALTDDGRLLVVESVVVDGPKGNGARLMDVEMLFGPGGRQRTEAEHAALFDAAGLRFERLIPTAAGTSIVEGTRVA